MIPSFFISLILASASASKFECVSNSEFRISNFSSCLLTKLVEHPLQAREQLLFGCEAGAPARTHVLDTSGEGTPLRPRLARELHHEGFVDRQARNVALRGCWRRPIAIGAMRCHMAHIYRQACAESITRCGKVLGNFRETFCPSHGGLSAATPAREAVAIHFGAEPER
jgi:hypothetical protein